MVQTWGMTTEEAAALEEDERARWRSPQSLTSFIEVPDDDIGLLNLRLDALASRFRDQLRNVHDLHSFRLCAIPEDDDSPRPMSVMLNSVHDLPLEPHLNDLLLHAGDLLAEAFAVEDEFDSMDELRAMILRNRIREDTVYLGSINRTVEQIHEEDRFRREVQEVIAAGIKSGRWNEDSQPETIRRAVRDHFLTNPGSQTRESAAPVTLTSRWLKFVDLLRTFILFPFIGTLAVDINEAIARISNGPTRRLAWLAYGFWWVYGFVFTATGFLLARYLELVEPESEISSPDPDLVAQLEASEDKVPKNAVTLLFDVRDSRIRRWMLGMILRGAELGCRHFWTDGKLTGISTIHYARIFQVNNDRQMLFMSDYDGSLNRYLDDFLSVGKRAVIPFTSNLVGCPKTKWLFGMADSTHFSPRWKRMIRRYQLPTAVWYSAYPEMTVEEILNNAELRNELFADQLTPEQVNRWLRRL